MSVPRQERIFGPDFNDLRISDVSLEILKTLRGQIFMPFGGGVNSVASYLLMLDLGFVPGRDFTAYMMDHGSEWPETYEYLYKYFFSKFQVMPFTPDVEHHQNLYEYFLYKRTIPSITKRDCTWKFKCHPGNMWMKRNSHYPLPVIRLLGFDNGEPWRGNSKSENPNIHNIYILREAGLDRDACVRYIESKGVRVPPKSSCWFCPFQSRDRWKNLKEKHPDLFQRAVILEEVAIEDRRKRGKGPIYLTGTKPLIEFVGGEWDPLLPLVPVVQPPDDYERISNIIDRRFLQVFGWDAHLVHADALETIRVRTSKYFGFNYDPDFEEQAVTFNIAGKDQEIRRIVWPLIKGYMDGITGKSSRKPAKPIEVIAA